MSTYGRNFEFRVTPISEHRMARFSVPTTGDRLPIGVPIQADVSEDPTDLGLQPVELGLQSTTTVGLRGILVYEYGPAAYAGTDELLTTFSDLDTAPLGAAVQMVHGSEVKVLFRNTEARTFLATRSYPARTMVAGTIGSTLAPGVYLEPVVTSPSDTNGYWEVASSVGDAWLVIESVDADRGEVEARMLF